MYNMMTEPKLSGECFMMASDQFLFVQISQDLVEFVRNPVNRLPPWRAPYSGRYFSSRFPARRGKLPLQWTPDIVDTLFYINRSPL